MVYVKGIGASLLTNRTEDKEQYQENDSNMSSAV